MSGCDRMTTTLGILGLSFAIFIFIAKQYLSYRFFFHCYGYVEFIKFYLFLLFFIVLACIVIHCLSCIYIGYGSKAFIHHSSHF
jgi:hypothetical protein